MNLKTLFALVLGSSLTLVYAADKPAVHGMLMFGEKSVYLSHLPMFHNPHHYQGIVKVKVGLDSEAKFFNDQKANPGMIYTFVPKPAVLEDLFTGKAQLEGDIYRGHFERGGIVIAKGVTATIAKVIHFRKFDPQASKPKTSKYLLFGEPGDSWIAHYISLKPDFDHIASVEVPGGPASEFSAEIQIPGVSDAKPLEVSGGVNAQDANGKALRLEKLRNKYLEFGDLEM